MITSWPVWSGSSNVRVPSESDATKDPVVLRMRGGLGHGLQNIHTR